jgi:hypothetical protein
LIEDAYRAGVAMGLAVWCTDQAGPYQTIPYPGQSWRPEDELVCWLLTHGVMPLYTPVGGSWLNMAESLQRVLKRRALGGQHPKDTAQIIAWFEAVARHWNAAPTPFVGGGKRSARPLRPRERRYRVGGSGACTRTPLRRASRSAYGHGQAK